MPTATGHATTSIEVKDLGTAQGWFNHEDGTTQFFGIPYADIPARFRHSTLKTAWPNRQWDARKLGGHAPQPERPFYPFPMPARDHLGEAFIDEFECLNMQITLPRGCSPEDKLPVLVFIHGGGYVFGRSCYGVVDGRPLARRSIELGMPTIIITFNYRVGFYGFLASDDIRDDNKQYGGGNGNFGVIDQKNALLWLNRYIHNFGGDPSRILLTGQSAGAISVDMHVQSPWNNLFSTAVLQSGTIPICGMYTEEEYHVLYMKLLGVCGIDKSLPPSERLEALRNVPHEIVSQQTYEVFQGLNLPQFGICLEPYIFGGKEKIPTPSWYNGGKYDNYKGTLVIGDCMHEAIIYDQAFRDYSVQHVTDLVNKHLKPDLAKDTLIHYNIHDGMTQQELYLACEALATDGLFTAPPYLVAKANPRAHVYHWDHRSQFDNPWGGFAHHSLDYLWLFGGLHGIQTEEERELARSLQSDWIHFANGQPPYPPTGAEGFRRVYGPNSKCTLETAATYKSRPFEWFERIRNELEDFDKLCTDIIMRRPELMSYEYGPGTKNAVKVTQGKPLAL
ncbi:Alpha/Beta hydrolase protein [Naematelia encephala]|uniref:Carboxylic ester hydrolase n=1 Tax=Naematelia encephala TaxID=71784 RepID=A0A1Y2AW38_9TREE|nr:Alpha/Beta hydrolase protein [Naematelia encephala]